MSPVHSRLFWYLRPGIYRRARARKTVETYSLYSVIASLKHISPSNSGASYVLTFSSSLGTGLSAISGVPKSVWELRY